MNNQGGGWLDQLKAASTDNMRSMALLFYRKAIFYWQLTHMLDL
jgi:hypothetical protein